MLLKKKLKNGLTVLFEKREPEVVSVAIATRFGSINESLDEKGIAHFIEHMLYKGTSKRSAKQISEEIEKKGGILNGFTSEQLTVYWCKLPSKHLNISLEVLSDMIKNPLFDSQEIEKERKVILEEMKMWRDNPHLRVNDKIQSNLYKGTLGLSTIGTEKTLSGITREKMIKKFEEVYPADNLILCVVGKANFKKICAFAEKNFKKATSKISKPKIQTQNKQETEYRKGIDQANMVFAYHVPKATQKGHYSAQVLNALMVGGMSSILFSEIREKRNLAYAIKGNCNCEKDFGYNSIYVGTTKENITKVKKIILKEFSNIKYLSQKTLNEVKEQLIGNNKIGKEDSQGQMLELIYFENFGKVKEAYNYEKNIRNVKLTDVKKLAAYALKNHSFFSLIPKNG